MCVVGVEQRHEQCKDPLFQTHWSGKNDIQTLTAFPVIKTNLKRCPAYNERASCCHQTFESEQLKYFGFWESRFQAKLLRAAAHRDSIIVNAGEPAGRDRVVREQYEVVLDRYQDVLAPRHQARCFNSLLAYVAGMVCFSCKPEWFHYTVLTYDKPSYQGNIVRVRMARSVCLELWDSCRDFGRAASKLKVALRDSAIARGAPLAAENLDMFMGQQQLCDWMHDEVAMHPFRLEAKEDRDIPTVNTGFSQRAPVPIGRPVTAGGAPLRRLGLKRQLNVLAEGRDSMFDLTWHSPGPATSTASSHQSLQLLACAAISFAFASTTS